MPRNKQQLTEPQGRLLRWLHQQGGSGTLDIHGLVMANGKLSWSGSQVTALILCARDYLTAGGGRIALAERGKQYIEQEQQRRELRALDSA